MLSFIKDFVAQRIIHCSRENDKHKGKREWEKRRQPRTCRRLVIHLLWEKDSHKLNVGRWFIYSGKNDVSHELAAGWWVIYCGKMTVTNLMWAGDLSTVGKMTTSIKNLKLTFFDWLWGFSQCNLVHSLVAITIKMEQALLCCYFHYQFDSHLETILMYCFGINSQTWVL